MVDAALFAGDSHSVMMTSPSQVCTCIASQVPHSGFKRSEFVLLSNFLSLPPSFEKRNKQLCLCIVCFPPFLSGTAPACMHT